MGGCTSAPDAPKAQKERPDKPSAAPAAAAAGEGKEKRPAADVKVVLLGPGESGKSTIFKQMKVIQARDEGKEGFTKDELLGYRGLVFANIVTQMKVLASVALDEGMEFSSEDVQKMAQTLSQTQVQDLELESAQVGSQVKTLWAEETIKEVYAERDRLFNINDGAG